ncbi:hypothetical protein MNBD_GAMMA20-1938 [hydrothermal vent metagenome]|uniref:DUF1295 domain-containing protein n=1 Tax=hydrothermal vent metagenome TaxID=652676 RepID=A0A3B0ZZ30_9ZZZZ
MRQALSPHFYVSATLLVTAGSLFLFHLLGLEWGYIFLPVLALAVLYGLVYFIRQCRRGGLYHIDGNIEPAQLLRRAIARYLVWLVVLYGGYQFYLFTPWYNNWQHQTTQQLFADFLHIYLWAGIPYFALTLTFKASRREDFYDPAIRMLHVLRQIGRQLWQRLRHGNDHTPLLRVLHRPYNRKVFLNLVMRAYFLPVMVEQVGPASVNTLQSLYAGLDGSQIMSWVLAGIAMLWLMDILNASVAYAMESRWLENRSRSIDLTLGGWLVCLSSYPPLNEATGTLFAFAPFVATGQPDDLVYVSIGLLYALKIAEALLLGVHIYTDVSLGPSVANITLKKLQTRGMYGFIRHPGTVTKLLFWLLQSAFYRQFWTARFLFGYLGWGTLYVLRALTEERHLSKFAEYREYRKKVKYRFIPGIW